MILIDKNAHINKCHLCNSKLFPYSVLQLNGMPKAAQYYPNENEFKDDKGIILNIFQCSDCGLVQLNINPVDYFKEVITSTSFSEKTKISRLTQMKKFINRFNLKDKKILEVGCGKGNMLDILKEAGAKPIGIEASLKSAKIGKSAGRNIINCYIGDMENIRGNPFDAFVSFNYLEHLPEPGAIIKNIYNNLTAKGIGFVIVPNLEYLIKIKCFYEFVADHLSYFTKKTLTYAFEKNGFDVLECYTINDENDIAVIVKKKEPLEISKKFNEVEKLIKNLKKIVASYKKENKKIAVWGAGHRTLALLALSKLNDIEYVVDSAKFKQGRYTPILHLKIVPPIHLLQESVDLVIVMVPGLYPDEVLKTIKKMEVASDVIFLRDNKLVYI